MATYSYNVGVSPNTSTQGKLNPNEIFGSIFNMIIDQRVFADNIKGVYGGLVSKFRTNGTLYGDTKLFYATDALQTHNWLNDAEAANLLKLHRPAGPKVQAVTIDSFRFVPLTVDNYLTKRAWATEGAFSNFTSVMLGWMRETKRIYDATLINAFVGTTKGSATKSIIEVPVSTATQGLTGEEKARVSAQTIAKSIADLLVAMKDVSRDYNDYAFLRSYDESDLMFVWNADYVNKITNIDLPTVFHKDGLFNSFENVLPSRFFGTIKTTDVAKANNDGTYRSLIETNYTSATSAAAVTSANTTHVFPGDLIPAATVKYDEDTNTIKSGILANEAYTPTTDVICKVVHKDSVPFMSAFETATSFYNPRALTETHYLIWGYSTPVYLKDKPFLVVTED